MLVSKHSPIIATDKDSNALGFNRRSFLKAIAALPIISYVGLQSKQAQGNPVIYIVVGLGLAIKVTELVERWIDIFKSLEEDDARFTENTTTIIFYGENGTVTIECNRCDLCRNLLPGKNSENLDSVSPSWLGLILQSCPGRSETFVDGHYEP